MSLEHTKYFDFSVKTDEDTPGRFSGLASTFGNVDLQDDRMMRGAFTDTLKESKGLVPVLMGHIGSRIVGFVVEAAEDSKGLHVTAEFTLDSDEGRNAYAITKHAAKLGHKLGLSVGYQIRPDGSKMEANGVRQLLAVNLFEVSIAAIPANPRARITGVKAEDISTISEVEDALRDAGFSRNEAKTLVSKMKTLRDAESDDDLPVPEDKAPAKGLADVIEAAYGLLLIQRASGVLHHG
jgi:uncharacterized protein